MASNIAQQRIQREFREVVKSEEVAASGVQVRFWVDLNYLVTDHSLSYVNLKNR